MIAINYTTARQNFKDFCDKTVNDFETVIITRERGENVVLLSESEYNNMIENLYVRSNSKDYKELLESIQQLKKGQGKIRELIEDE
ncbi:MAG: type II toxin-antitoxin system prevent-host-death family antitoxin [Oscillospiraceae bacterium]|nr:type II toxin-antitoxin system prevent-host-death family antitoxin [Oscillospiraceae bacterium]